MNRCIMITVQPHAQGYAYHLCSNPALEGDVFCKRCKEEFPKASDVLIDLYRTSTAAVETGVWITR